MTFTKADNLIPFVSVAQKARGLLQSWADRPDTRDACLEYVRTDIFVPILDLSSIIVPKELLPQRGLSRVAIQGNFDQYMRDYEGTFRDLVRSLKGGLPLAAKLETRRWY